jgi:protease-4
MVDKTRRCQGEGLLHGNERESAMRVFAGLLSVMLAVVAGCAHPVRVASDNHITVDGPVATNSRVHVEVPPVSDGGPVTAMPLPGGSAPCAGAKVAVVDVDGLLGNSEYTGPYSLGENPVALFRERLDAVAADREVCAVVLRINSPGGSVTATDIMWHDLQAFREHTHLPVVACLMDVGAGGGYYLATASDVILAHPTTVTGGIGVILNLYNLRELMAQFNILSQEIKAGKLIDIGTPLRNLPDDAKQILQTMADEYHQRFIDVVRRARPQVQDRDGTTFDGRVFSAREAQERGLVDRLGYLDDAVAVAAELGRHPGAAPVLFRRHNDPARSLYGATPNVPLQATAWPVAIPGLDRSRLPAFLYLWEPETSMERLGGR